jgi:branched-chain amino acid transport system substrate-binding protein
LWDLSFHQINSVDALGYYMAPWSYAQLQVLRQAVVAAESLDDAKLGDVRFGSNGELPQSRVLQVQKK